MKVLGSKLTSARWEDHLVGMVEMRTKQDFEKPRRRWEDNTKIQMGCYGVD